MRKKNIVLLLNCLIVILLIIFFIKHNVFASVKINEIYPAPSSGGYEWVELYNDENSDLDILQNHLFDSFGHPILFSETNIQPYGFIIATSSSILNNDTDTVILKNNLDQIIDSVTYSGSFNSDKSYVSCPNGSSNWFILTSISKKSSNEFACLTLTPIPTLTPLITVTPTLFDTPTSTPEPTSSPTETPAPPSADQVPDGNLTDGSTPSPISYNNIFLTEVMANPETHEHEWIELYNNNDYSANLKNWYIDDAEDSGSSPKKITLNIDAKSYAIFDLTSSMFNNSGDVIRLLDFNKTLKDGLTYDSSLKEKTFGRISLTDNTFCFNEPTKGYTNSTCLNTDDDEDSNISPTPKPTLVKVVKTAKEKPSPTPKPIINNKTQLTAVNNTEKNNLIENQVVAMNNFNQNDFGQEEVLGSSIGNNNSNINKPLLNSLLFASCSLSFLISGSIIVKMFSSLRETK